MIVLSIVPDNDAAVLVNHRRYARRMGYTHRVYAIADMTDSATLVALYRHQLLLRALADVPLNAPVLTLDDSVIILGDQTLPALLSGRDRLVVGRVERHEALPQMQIWCNTPDNIALLRSKERMFHLSIEKGSESEVLADCINSTYFDKVNGMFPLLPAGYSTDPVWSREPTFAICNDQSALGKVPRFTRALVDHVEHCRALAVPYLKFPVPANDEALTIYNPGNRIAFVMLYCGPITVQVYGGIAEENYRRYCERHGYTLYVYRAPPKSTGFEGSGNWFKPVVLREVLESHEWAIWVDADTLVVDESRRVETLLDQRDRLLAQDIGGWEFNSGIMGFRATQDNVNLLDEIINQIKNVPDKSSVWASQSDQFYFVKMMVEAGYTRDEDISLISEINTLWIYRQQDSYIVHYYSMWPELRCLMMAHDA